MKNVNPFVFVCLVLGIFLINFAAQANTTVNSNGENLPREFEMTEQEILAANAEWENVMDYLGAGADVVAGKGGSRGAHCNVHGHASYYGPGFHGRRTASGQTFNRHAMTAAHKYLPFGTMVKVTTASGRSVTVRINDRGPFIKGRIIDLSEGAARAVGISTGRVHLQCL